ncbi:DUF2589 domain-containing protein [Streptomyces cinereoruber]|uniref:DUF2589 domain-containing protein n=1 Tax=Streptomyces cinereoruber TaxID=67260 RepID=A0ABX6B802_9ACTN|nr:DUF2589 domain-containing protein [Streptomyces cinereoruber]MBB4161598.1 hypothetical protein [Streptomyces cinereoruber]MBY8820619.1 DUF2589 domain-containing protein [Streptomyces cinereoruber]NIH65549.1 hypothetical protein [Streptomyces cinereoruber]QEV30950.1 DUF2589 domain-containing protein [Streptomyces cinereoruber]
MSDDDIPVGALLGAAYQAVVHGQDLAAREAVELVKELGFDKDGTAKPFRFAYQRTEATEAGPQVRTVHATVPLLSLVSPPTLSIDKAAISMSLHLISQDIETEPADASTADGETPAAQKTTPRLKGRIVHKDAGNAVMTIESTLKQRDLLGSSRLTQLLDAAVSDRDHLWYQVLDQAELFREVATKLIDAVNQDGSTGNAVGVRRFLQQLWQLKESVTDAVSAFRDGQPEKIPQLHQNWNTECGKLAWVDRHTEPESMTQMRQTFLATATAVWNALLPGAPVAQFGPPPVKQLQDRFESAATALAAASPDLAGLSERLRRLKAAVAQGCTARDYKEPDDITAALGRYNKIATEIRGMWNPSVLSRESWNAQDVLAAAAKEVWDALVHGGELEDLRFDVAGMEAKCTQALHELRKQVNTFPDQVQLGLLSRAYKSASDALAKARLAWKSRTRYPQYTDEITGFLKQFNYEIGRIERRENSRTTKSAWNDGVQDWNGKAHQFWGHLIDTTSHKVADIDSVK